jgi:hypothetical protein
MKLKSFESYEDYRKSQIKHNLRKKNSVGVKEQDIKMLSEWLLKRNKDLKFGICHGVRTGKENEWFENFLNVDVLGTDIAGGENILEWDFHNIKKEWIGNVDFIFSNALDHSYNPVMALEQWVKCLNNTGVVILQYSKGHGERYVRRCDCFGASLEEYLKMIEKKFRIIEVLTAGKNKFIVFGKAI